MIEDDDGGNDREGKEEEGDDEDDKEDIDVFNSVPATSHTKQRQQQFV